MKYALLFPGQGSQYKQLVTCDWSQSKIVKQTLSEASDISGFDIVKTLQTRSLKEITTASVAQPIVVAYSIAFYRAFMSKMDCVPSFIMGHSLGEISAYVASGVLSFSQALEFTVRRGKLMESIGVFNGSAALVLDVDIKFLKETVNDIHSLDSPLYLTGYNSVRQFVVSGDTSSLNVLDDAVETRGGQVVPFRMMPMKDPRPYHSPYMASLTNSMREALKKIDQHGQTIEVYSTIKNRFLSDEDNIVKLLALQLQKPVCWLQGVNAIIDESIDFMIDIGPNVIMRNLIDENQADIQCFAFEDQKEREMVFNYLGKGASNGQYA